MTAADGPGRASPTRSTDVPGAHVGIDACPDGWVAVVLRPGSPPEAVYAPTLAGLGAQLPDARAFAIDIPIGLPVAGPRAADLAARRALGPRRSSVFLTPIREALDAPNHAEATAVAAARTGAGISVQAYGMRHRISEARDWLDVAPAPVWEVHPEVCFAVLLGAPARAPKKSWAGLHERLEALRRAGIVLGALPGLGPKPAADDVLDAAAAAWSAGRLLRGEAHSLPADPEVDPATGRPIAIWV